MKARMVIEFETDEVWLKNSHIPSSAERRDPLEFVRQEIMDVLDDFTWVITPQVRIERE